jgi:hypothetical protein
MDGTIIVIFGISEDVELIDGLLSIGYTKELYNINKYIKLLKEGKEKLSPNIKKCLISKVSIESKNLIDNLVKSSTIHYIYYYNRDENKYKLHKIKYDTGEHVFDNMINVDIVEFELPKYIQS